ncbi:MAG: hypothetical protein ACYDC1_21140 [Limisphaerales bacterium]
MLWQKRDPEKHRYYCLPGMGRSNRRHHRVINLWAIAFGAIVSGVLGLLIYVLNRP